MGYSIYIISDKLTGSAGRGGNLMFSGSKKTTTVDAVTPNHNSPLSAKEFLNQESCQFHRYYTLGAD